MTELAEWITKLLIKDDMLTYRELVAELKGEGFEIACTTTYRVCQNMGVTEYSDISVPILSDENIRRRIEWAKHVLEKNPDHVLEFHHDEKWFYVISNRRKRKLLPGEEKKRRKQASRRYATKVMFSACVGMPCPEHDFDGKVYIRRVARKKRAKRRSWKGPKGEKVRAQCHFDRSRSPLAARRSPLTARRAMKSRSPCLPLPPTPTHPTPTGDRT